MSSSSARQKVQAARTDLVLDHPFFGVLALKLRIVEDPTCETAWTDGRSMGYSPTFVDALSREELLGVIAHEVLHCACGHPWRRDAREPLPWNYACDFAINYVLEEAGFKLPKFRLRQADFDGKSAEWIYARLPKQPQPPPQQGGNGQGKCSGQTQPGGAGSGEPGTGAGAPQQQNGDRPGAGALDVRDAPGQGQAADGTSESDWQQSVQQAAIAAKAAGKLPASLDRFAKAAVQPRVDWKSVLRRFMQSVTKSDYAWTRPNARYVAHGLYLPALRSEAMGPVAVVVDTSGSVDDVTLGIFARELNAVVSEARPLCTHVIYCDAKVHKIERFEADEHIELKALGGGGTAFGPALDASEQLDDEPVCLIYLTDLYGSHRTEPPPFPVLWASIGLQEAPYGEVVSLQDA